MVRSFPGTSWSRFTVLYVIGIAHAWLSCEWCVVCASQWLLISVWIYRSVLLLFKVKYIVSIYIYIYFFFFSIAWLDLTTQLSLFFSKIFSFQKRVGFFCRAPKYQTKQKARKPVDV